MTNADFKPHPNTISATLVENFIDTARTTKQPYIRVKLDDYRTPDDASKCPLVLVPTGYWIYPLLKDTKVTIYVPSDSPNSFTLYSVDMDLPKALLDDVSLPGDGNLVSFPAASKTLAVTYINEAFWVIAQDGATLVQAGKVLTFFKDEQVVSYTPSSGSYSILCGKYELEAKDLLALLASGGFNLESKNKFKMTSNNVTLKELFVKIFEYIKDLYQRMSDFETKTISVSASVSTVVNGGVCSPGGPIAGGTGSGTATQTITLTGMLGSAAAKPSEVDSFKANKSDNFFQE